MQEFSLKAEDECRETCPSGPPGTEWEGCVATRTWVRVHAVTLWGSKDSQSLMRHKPGWRIWGHCICGPGTVVMSGSHSSFPSASIYASGGEKVLERQHFCRNFT